MGPDLRVKMQFLTRMRLTPPTKGLAMWRIVEKGNVLILPLFPRVRKLRGYNVRPVTDHTTSQDVG